MAGVLGAAPKLLFIAQHPCATQTTVI